jgi:hypothetical protein
LVLYVNISKKWGNLGDVYRERASAPRNLLKACLTT